MTYTTGGSIQALDYNTFTTLVGGINEVFGDLNSGATTLPSAGFGYGQTPVPISVSIGNAITAAEWSAFFQTIRKSGTHQGTTVVPPLPVSDPAIGNAIVAYNTPSTLSTLVALLRTNKFNLAGGQTFLQSGTQYSSASNWLTLLTYSFRADFGSWNNARYFFNSGGSLQIVGAYPSAVTPIQVAWANALTNMSPLSFKYNSTTPNIGSNDAVLNPIGFWKGNNPLTTSYQIIYSKALGAGYYTSSFVRVEARLTALAGTNGQVDFRISLIDGDPTPDTKTFPINFTANYAKSAGAIAYPGPVTITSLGFTYT